MENLVCQMHRIGYEVPEFKAATTQRPINFSYDYTGKWKVLFSRHVDFTPIYTSEFVTFVTMQNEFEALNCQLVEFLVDGLYSQIAWLRTIIYYPLSFGCNFDKVRRVLIEINWLNSKKC